MATSNHLSLDEKEMLAKYEEELKDRYTDKDEEFMKVFNAEPLVPPIIQSWYTPRNNESRHRNDRRYNRRHNIYDRHDKYRDRQQSRY